MILMILGPRRARFLGVSDSGTALDGLLRDWVEPSVYDELNRVLRELPRLLERPSYNFQHSLYPSLRVIDNRIPGVGLHHVAWLAGLPRIPLPGAFEAVSRPLDQVARSMCTSDSPQGLASYSIATASTSHLEQCLKMVPKANPTRPLGALARQPEVITFVGAVLAGAIQDYATSLGNRAKHVMADGTDSTSPIGFSEAIRGYFAVRVLGAAVLEKIGILQNWVASTDNAAQSERFDTDADIAVRPDYGRYAHPGAGTYVRPTEISALPEFCEWLDSLRRMARIGVIAAIERLAAYGDDLADPHVTRWGQTLLLLEPEPPALGLSIVFVRLWGVKTVLLMGIDKWQLRKRPIRKFSAAWKKRRQVLRSIQRTVQLADIIGEVDQETRDEIDAAKVYMAATSIMFQEQTMTEARHMIQRDLDFLDKRPSDATSNEPTTEDRSSWSYREMLARYKLDSEIMKHLPYTERVPLAPVREAEPPKTWADTLNNSDF